MESSVYAELVGYCGKTVLGESSFRVNLSHKETNELFNELFGEADFEDIVAYFILIGILIDPVATDRLVLRIDDGNLSKLWIATKED